MTHKIYLKKKVIKLSGHVLRFIKNLIVILNFNMKDN